MPVARMPNGYGESVLRSALVSKTIRRLPSSKLGGKHVPDTFYAVTQNHENDAHLVDIYGCKYREHNTTPRCAIAKTIREEVQGHR
jgi:hypothetical protein